MIKVFFINLGCHKNLVDSEAILGSLEQNGITISPDAESSGILILNTCAFIESAKEEAIDTIISLADLKKLDPKKKIVVIGCLVQRYKNSLIKEMPEVDTWISLDEIPKIPGIIKKLAHNKIIESQNIKSAPSTYLYDGKGPRHLITPSPYAYIKIAEGCDNRCSYCAVPLIKGNFRSRRMGSILREADSLTHGDAREINLIAQDTTSYGKDLSPKQNIAALLNKLCGIENIRWIRLLYAHPAHITDELIDEMATQTKICKYIDIPLQHINNRILKQMGRKITKERIREVIEKIRLKIPSVILRTTFIVGFPGETKREFQELLDFVKEIKFERLGVFKYSREEDTPAYKMKNQIPEDIKEERFHTIMKAQKKIAARAQKSFVGRTLEVLIEGVSESKPSMWYGRSYADAPDVDGVIYISNGKTLKKGDIIAVKIIKAIGYDLVGEKNKLQTANIKHPNKPQIKIR